MLSNIIAIALATLATQAEAKNVFAHFIVGNAIGNNVLADWTADITAAKAAHIDGFALNIASGQTNATVDTLKCAFSAANTAGDFKLFFSFDFNANPTEAWAAGDISSLLTTFATNGAYFTYNGKPMVSTFEGPASSSIWPAIKTQFNLFFIPDWSSENLTTAVATGVVDGLLSWNAWPTSAPAADMTTSSDTAFVSALGSKPYMMPVSPWFYTNLPGYGKNWLWRGDDLWYYRWQQVLTIDPEFVEIVTWNDYGESHYIGPINTKDLGLFTSGGAPFDYAINNPHDGWRTFLPYIIDTYKNGAAPTIPSEQVVTSYRLNPNKACDTGGTTGNNPSQGNTEVDPATLDVDAVFYTALLHSSANANVTIGSNAPQSGTWTNTPKNGASGLYHGSVPFNGRVGQVTVEILRDGLKVVSITGDNITTTCTAGIVNWNAAVFTSDTTPI